MARRVAYLRLCQETNAHSPAPTELADFERSHLVLDPSELARRVRRTGAEVPGFVRNAELSGFVRAVARFGRGEVEPVPIASAWAVSGGSLSRSCYAALKGRILSGLAAAGPLDGVFLALHGAMGVEGLVDPESDLLAEVRAVVGPGAKLAASLDLHGNLTRGMVEGADVLAGYHTNPHRDHAGTGFRAGRALVSTVLGEARPTAAWRKLPMVLGGGVGVDLLAPMRSIFRRLGRLTRRPGVLDASLFMCHPWNDDPSLGWATYAVTDGDQALAERVADELAERVWGVRHEQLPELPEPEEAFAAIRARRGLRKLGPACVCDASDVVGAGGTGENTRLVKALLEEGSDLRAYAPIRDAEVVASLWGERVGEPVSVDVGGRFDAEVSPPLRVVGRLARKRVVPGMGRAVVIESGRLALCVTEGPPMVMKPSFYRMLGLEPFRADVVVVKSFFPFRLFFLAENRLSLYVRTHGITDFDGVTRLEFDGPVHPLQEIADWRAEDERRRSV